MFNILFPLALLSVVSVMIIFALGYDDTARFFPLLVMLPVAALLVLEIFLELRTRVKQKTGKPEGGPAEKTGLAAYLKSQAWVVLLLLSLYFLGFIAGSALFLLIYLRTHEVKWLYTAISVVVTVAVIYGAFGLLFEVYLYEGLLFSKFF